MTEKVRKPRSDSKMYQLPKDVLDQVNNMLLNENMKYSDIQYWLETEHNMKISLSSISNYAVKIYQAAQRISDDLERTKFFVDYIGDKSELDASKAKNYLRCKEYRYLSPVVIIQKNSHRVSQLHSVALTNTPAINGMTPIINSATISSGVTYTLNDTEKEICKMLNLKESDYADYCMRRGKSG